MSVIILPRHQMDSLLARASRAEPESYDERMALLDAQDQISTDDLTEAQDASVAAEQLTLFDPTPYEV